HQIWIRGTFGIGDRHAFQPEPRPGKDARGNVPRDDDTPAREPAAVILECGTITVPIDNERRAEQPDDEQHERDPDIDDRRLPHAHGAAFPEPVRSSRTLALSTPEIFKSLPICQVPQSSSLPRPLI